MAKNKVSVSIIIPVYNTEEYLSECLSSIINQNLDEYEIIIINDGSTDSSESIIKQYIDKYSFIKYYFQENEGQAVARNYGISVSSGEYLYFMDSDDYLKNGSLGELYEEAKQYDLDAIFFDGESFIDDQSDKSNDMLLKKFNYFRYKNYGLYESGEQLMIDFSKDNNFFVSPCLYLVKKEIIVKNKLKFPEKIKHEDELFTTNLFLYINKCVHTNKILFMRRIRQNSTMTTSNKSDSLLGYTKVISILNTIYFEHKFENKNSKKAFKKKIEQNYKSAILTYYRIQDKNRFANEYYEIQKVGKKYNYFNIKTIIFIILIKNKKAYQFFDKNK